MHFLTHSLIGDILTDGPTRYLYHHNMLSKLQIHLLIVPMSNLKWSSPVGHSSKFLAWRKSTNKRKQKQKARAITTIQSDPEGNYWRFFYYNA